MSVLSKVRGHYTISKRLSWRKKTAIMAVAILQAVSLSIPVLVPRHAMAVSAALPSTNSVNTTKSWAHVNVANTGIGQVTLDFVSTRSFNSCFEYRTDGDTSQAVAVPNPNTEIADLYPSLCVKNSTQQKTIAATEYVEVRLAFGAEKDERFDWTKFAVLPQPDTAGPQVTYTSPSVGAIVGDTNLSATITDATNITQYSFNVTGPKSWSTDKWYPNQKSANVAVNLCDEDRLSLCDEAALPSGTYSVRVAAYDGLGNRNISSATTFVFDADGPAVSITSPASGATVNQVLVDGTVSDQKLSFFNVQLSKVGDSKWNFTTQKQYATSGQTIYTLTDFDLLDAAYYGTCDGQPCSSWNGTAPLPDGTYALRVNAYDQFNNRTIYAHNFTLDATAPATPTLVFPANNAVVNAKTKAIANDWNDVADAVRYRYQSYNVKSNGTCNLSSVRFTGLYTASQTESRTIADGLSFCWRVTAIDAVGNESAWSPLWKVTVDNTAPVVQITAPADGALLRGTVTISGIVVDTNPHHYYLVVKSGNGNVIGGPKTVYKTTVADFNWNTVLVPDGDYTIHLEARDAAGNKSGSSMDVITVTVDNTAPVVTVNALTTTATSPELTGEINDPAATLTVTVNGQSYTTEIVTSGNTWTLPAGVIAPALAVGIYTVNVTATDLAGNSASHGAPLTITQVVSSTPTTPGVSLVSVTTSQTLGTAIRRLTPNTQSSTQTQPEVGPQQVASANTTADESKEKGETDSQPATEAATARKSNTWVWFLGAGLLGLLVLVLLYRRFNKAGDR